MLFKPLNNGMVFGMSNENYYVLSGKRATFALRHTGYKTTGNALGELVDNSIQAEATKIKIIVEVRNELRVKRTRQSITRIGVLDNGVGMSSDELRHALMFGEGTHFDEESGLGKFGVGLPQASLSQCTFIQVWTWQNGVDSSIHTGYNIDDPEWNSNGCIVPEPQLQPIPAPWLAYVDQKQSGTLVVWSNLDNITCSSANTLFDKSEYLIGRMYRNWIHDNKVSIEYVVLDADSYAEVNKEKKFFRAVDPLYIMENTSDLSCSPPVYPMFEEMKPFEMRVGYKGVETTVTIRVSIAKKEIRDMINSGKRPGAEQYGKHAMKNVGLSIVREGRELELDPNWSYTESKRKDPKNRWWGAQIEFGRELDELFGVTNDKQSATNLRNAYNDQFKDHIIEGESLNDVKERMMEEEPKLALNISIAEQIRTLIKNAISKIPEEKDESVSNKRDSPSPEKQMTEAIVKQRSEGIEIGFTDESSEKAFEVKKTEFVQGLRNIGVNEADIEAQVKSYIDFGYSFHFLKKPFYGEDAFFVVNFDGGVMTIVLNTAHPLYKELFAVFDYIDTPPEKDYTAEELKNMLHNTYDAMKFMLASWARLEDIAVRNKKNVVSKQRKEWGQMASQLKGVNLDDE